MKWVGWWGKVFLAEFGGGDGRKVGGGVGIHGDAFKLSDGWGGVS